MGSFDNRGMHMPLSFLLERLHHTAYVHRRSPLTGERMDSHSRAGVSRWLSGLALSTALAACAVTDAAVTGPSGPREVVLSIPVTEQPNMMMMYDCEYHNG